MYLPAPGEVLVEVSGSLGLFCTASGPCHAAVSAFLDGTAVPGAHYELNAAAKSEDEDAIAVSGIAFNVPSGTHTVQIETSQSGSVETTNPENLHLTAVALGNNSPVARLHASAGATP